MAGGKSCCCPLLAADVVWCAAAAACRCVWATENSAAVGLPSSPDAEPKAAEDDDAEAQ